MKGKFKINDIEVEIEGDVTSIVNVIDSLKKLNKAAFVSQNADNIKKETTPKKTVRLVKGKERYTPWTKHDISLMIRTIFAHGEKPEGVDKEVYRVLRSKGEIRSKSFVNISIISKRIHRYMFTGVKDGIPKHMMTLIDSFTFTKHEENVGKKVEYLKQSPEFA